MPRQHTGLVAAVRNTALALLLAFGLHGSVQSQPSGSAEKQKASSAASNPGSKSTPGTVFDRSKGKTGQDDFVVVPKGQEISIEVVFPDGSAPTTMSEQGKVVIPVRVGFTTAIPAGTGVHLRFAGSSEDGPLCQISTIELNKTTYRVESSQEPYSREMRFTLTKPLRVAR